VPGAKLFLDYADSLGVEIIYLTNRAQEIEEVTEQNLINAGLPFDEEGDHLLTKHEQEGWGSDKGSRRTFAAEQYRIVMIFGDNLNDFVSGTRVEAQEREGMWEPHGELWSAGWYMLPNPDYGDWEGAIYDWKWPESDAEKLKLKYDALEMPE
jgi:acid phosphatase